MVIDPVRVRLWLAYASRTHTESTLGEAGFDWLGARGDVCWLNTLATRLRLALCGRLELGYQRGEGLPGVDLSETHDKGAPWVASGALAGLGLDLAESWRLEILVGPEFPLYRERFTFRRSDGEQDVIYRTPGAGWVASTGVTYVLP
jgi:hypothetical protein